MRLTSCQVCIRFLWCAMMILGPGLRVAAQLLRPPAEYYSELKRADSLAALGRYQQATGHLDSAFASFGGRGTAADRFKAIRIYALAGNYEAAFMNMERLWQQDFVNHLKFETDPAFVGLRVSDTARFDHLVERFRALKDSLEPGLNLAWANFLDSIYQEDQGLRRQWQQAANQYGLGSAEANRFWPEIEHRDSLNLVAVSAFIGAHGWQGKEVVGKNGNAALFLVIQHADSAMQEKYLPILRKAVREGKASPADLALLTDRLCVAKHGYQIYGSQLHEDPITHKNVFYPIKNERSVDRRRRKMKLQPLAEYAKYFGIEYKGRQ